MATYVLVHGAWSGAHGFRTVRRLLQTAGHEVLTPSLTGVGERAHLLTPLIDLTTHIQDVVNVVLYEDLDEIVLLGFSYGGAVVTGSVAHIPAASASSSSSMPSYPATETPSPGSPVGRVPRCWRWARNGCYPRRRAHSTTPTRRSGRTLGEGRNRPGASRKPCG